MLSDLDALLALEHSSFAAERQEGRSSLRRSIVSVHQEVWLLQALRSAPKQQPHETPIMGAAILRIFAKSLRIYSIAIGSAYRGRGYGQLLLDHAICRARKLGKTFASLEADAANTALLRWYSANNFTVTRHLPDYYGKQQDAVRMRLRL